MQEKAVNLKDIKKIMIIKITDDKLYLTIIIYFYDLIFSLIIIIIIQAFPFNTNFIHN